MEYDPDDDLLEPNQRMAIRLLARSCGVSVEQFRSFRSHEFDDLLASTKTHGVGINPHTTRINFLTLSQQLQGLRRRFGGGGDPPRKGIDTFAKANPTPRGVSHLNLYPFCEEEERKGCYVDLSACHPPPGENPLRLVLLSDIHITGKEDSLGYYEKLPFTSFIPTLPRGDILIISGDLTGTGTIDELVRVRTFLDAIVHADLYKHILFIAGNHDRILDKNYFLQYGLLRGPDTDIDTRQRMIDEAHARLFDNLPSNIHYLLDESRRIEGYNFYGSPWVKPYDTGHKWGFECYDPQLAEKYWPRIPSDVDILITHQPPLNHGDLEPMGPHGDLIHTGSASLLERVKQIQPLLHIFGHVHEGYGATRQESNRWIGGQPLRTAFVNPATVDANYKPNQLPLVVDLPRRFITTQL